MKTILLLVVATFIIGESACFSVEEKQADFTQEEIKKRLVSIPKEDLIALERFFNFTVRSDCFAYSLFGYKPVSLSGSFFTTPPYNILSGMLSGSIFWKYWTVWEKYQSLFPSKTFLFMKEDSQTVPEAGLVILINKKLFLETVFDHLPVFQEILGQNCTPQSLLEEIEVKKSFVSAIQNNEVLWGILLGYGEENAKLYEKRRHLGSFPSSKDLPKKFHQDWNAEYSFVKKHLEGIGNVSQDFMIVGAVAFMGDPSSHETKRLVQKYSQARAQLNQIYSKGSLLEITLSQLISG